MEVFRKRRPSLFARFEAKPRRARRQLICYAARVSEPEPLYALHPILGRTRSAAESTAAGTLWRGTARVLLALLLAWNCKEHCMYIMYKYRYAGG